MKWTKKEFEQMIQLLKEGVDTEDVASVLGRSVLSIRNKCFSEGFKITNMKYPIVLTNCKTCKKSIESKRHLGRTFCSRSCAASFSNENRSKLVYEKISNILKAKRHRPPSAPKKEKLLKECPICKISFETIPAKKSQIFCSKKCYTVDCKTGHRFSKEPSIVKPRGGYRENSTRKHRQSYKGFWMDSGSEKIFAKLLDDFDIKWIKNSKTFFEFEDTKGKIRKYYPDFYLPDYDFWIEIKGRYYETDNLGRQLESVGENIELMYHNKIRLPRCITS